MSFNISNDSVVENPNISLLSIVDDESRRPRIVFLALFILVSLIGNTCLIIVILQNKKYRCVVLNMILLNQAIINLFDSTFNMPLVFGSLIAIEWVYGDVMCQFNTFCMNIVIVETVLTLTTLTVERFIAVMLAPARYGSILSPPRTLFGLSYTWFHAFGFSLPLLVGAVPSTFRNQLHLCSISDSSSLTFICLTSIVCFVVPAIIMFVLFILIFKAAYQDRFSVRAKMAQQSYTEKNVSVSQITREIDMVKLAGTLLLIWVFVEIPYIVTAYIKQYQYSQEFQLNPNIGQLDYPWAVDVTFVWIRFSFAGILPILTFAWKRDLWRTWKDTVLCRPSNSVNSLETAANRRSKNASNVNVANLKSREKAESLANPSFNVPVLFATANGIHVQTDQGNLADSDIFYTEVPSTDQTAADLKYFKGKKLDVISALEYIPPDTSDYDSNSDEEITDQYSVSQPISTRQLEGQKVDRVPRSASQPDVQERPASSRASTSVPFEGKLTAVSYGTDSGLDLSCTSKCHETLALKDDRLNVDKDSNIPRERTFSDTFTVTLDNTAGNNAVEHIAVKPDDDTFGADSKHATGNHKWVNNLAQSSEPDTTKSSNAPDNTLIDVQPVSNYAKAAAEECGATITSQTLHPINFLTHFDSANILSQTVIINKKPPLHLEPLSVPRIEQKTGKKKKSRKVTSQTIANNLSLGEIANMSKRNSKSGHKRHGTADSQKALLGSSSSAELSDMKAEMKKMAADGCNPLGPVSDASPALEETNENN